MFVDSNDKVSNMGARKGKVVIVDKKQLLMFFIQAIRHYSINTDLKLFGMSNRLMEKRIREKHDECICTKQQYERWLLCNFKRIIVVSILAVIWPPPPAYLPLISGCSIVWAGCQGM